MINDKVREQLAEAGFFAEPGAYVLVDGQFGSTGKGLAAALLAEYDLSESRVDVVTTNAGPNSGHTAVMDNGRVIMTQQIPVFSAVTSHYDPDMTPLTILNGGAVLDMKHVDEEQGKYGVVPKIHPSAAVISPQHQWEFNSGGMDAIASTGKGVGQAMAAKCLRMPVTAGTLLAEDPRCGRHEYTQDDVVFIETAQGFSLGFISGFYPYTTSRECTVAQALADAEFPPQLLKRVIMCLRTFPIRVGNTTMGNSGPGYPDQVELTWEQVGQEPELTTVTKRVRRVFSWSRKQFRAAVRANRPDVLFINFAQYLTREGVSDMLYSVLTDYEGVMGEGRTPTLLLGFGPKTCDIYTYEQWLNQETPL